MISPNSGLDLARWLHVSPAHLNTLKARLAAAADAEGILQVAYRTLDTPVGSLLLAATEAGLVRVAHDAVLQDLAGRVSPRILHATARLERVATELEQYFAGLRPRFDLPVDWRLSRGFGAGVLHHLAADLPYGRTASRRAGRRSQSRPRGRHRVRD